MEGGGWMEGGGRMEDAGSERLQERSLSLPLDRCMLFGSPRRMPSDGPDCRPAQTRPQCRMSLARPVGQVFQPARHRAVSRMTSRRIRRSRGGLLISVVACDAVAIHAHDLVETA